MTAERAQRARSNTAVDADAGRRLEAANRRRGAGAIAAVDRSRRLTAPGEHELEGGHVPAAVAGAHDPRPEGGRAAAAQCAAGARTGDPVGRKVAGALEAPCGRPGTWAADSVDRAAVLVQRLQGNLERGHIGVAARTRNRGEH